MENNYENDLLVSGAFEAGNMDWGHVTVPVTANTVSSTTVSGLSVQGAGQMQVFLTANTGAPSTGVECESVSDITGGESFQIHLYRSTSTDTRVSWFAYREVS